MFLFQSYVLCTRKSERQTKRARERQKEQEREIWLNETRLARPAIHLTGSSTASTSLTCRPTLAWTHASSRTCRGYQRRTARPSFAKSW